MLWEEQVNKIGSISIVLHSAVAMGDTNWNKHMKQVLSSLIIYNWLRSQFTLHGCNDNEYKLG